MGSRRGGDLERRQSITVSSPATKRGRGSKRIFKTYPDIAKSRRSSDDYFQNYPQVVAKSLFEHGSKATPDPLKFRGRKIGSVDVHVTKQNTNFLISNGLTSVKEGSGEVWHYWSLTSAVAAMESVT